MEQPAPTIEKNVTIVNQKGLHARASAKFATTALTFKAEITVTKEGITVNGSSIMGLLLLAAQMGQTIVIRAKGDDAANAMAALEDLIARKFDET